MAEEETLSCVPGFRFNPLDEELITHYLKPSILQENLPCNIIKLRQVYGSRSNPWHVFDPNDNRLWFTSPDIKKTEKYMFAFAELSKLSTSNSSGTFKNTSKKAGCGTWVGKTCRDQITDDENNVIGEKRYLAFEIKDDSAAAVGGVDLNKVGFFRMHEYRLSGVNSGLDSATVLCKITHDSSKVCQIAKKAGTKSSNHILTSSRKAVKKEDNNNNLQSDSAKAEKLTLIDCGGGGDNLDESKTFNSQSLVESNSDISDWPAAPQYNGGVQEVDELGGHFCFDDLGDSFDYLAAADNGFQAFNEFGMEPSFDICGDNLDESKTFNSQSLVESNSDVSDWPAAPQYNGGVQEVDELGGHFCSDGLSDSFDYIAADNGFQAFNEFGLEPSFDMNWFTGLLTSDQEEGAVEDISKLGKRRFEEEDSNGSKKMCL